MKMIPIIPILVIALLNQLKADEEKKVEIVGVEISMSVEIYGGGSCYLGKDGSIVLQVVAPDRKKGHGMIEKRYVMEDELKLRWSSLNKKVDIAEVLKTERKTDVGIVGDSKYILRVYYSDGSSMQRWSFSDDPIASMWLLMADGAWENAYTHIPLLTPYERKNFGNLRRYLQKAQQDAVE